MKERSNERKLVQGALVPSFIVGVIGLCGFTLLRGRSGLYGALLAQVIVLIFFAVHLIISKFSKESNPITTMVLALTSYFLKAIILGAFLLILVNKTDPATLDRTSFGAVAIAITLAWMGGEIRAFLKLQLHLPLPGTKVSNGKQDGES